MVFECVPSVQFKMLHSSQVSREECSSSSVPRKVLQQRKGLAVALMGGAGMAGEAHPCMQC